MKPQAIPFNIQILSLTPEKLRFIRPVTVLDTFSGGTQDFHPDGLFSTEIFGRIGDERRDFRFSFIDIKVPILHPLLFEVITKLRKLYIEIFARTSYAKWDEEKKDFVRSSLNEGGRTGFAFFMEYWNQIDYGPTKSTRREQYVSLVQKYEKDSLTDKIIVLPAGLRDFEIDEYNRRSEDEINTLYRQAIALSNTIQKETVKEDISSLDIPRYRLQLVFNQIYQNIKNLIEGKRKLILGKWTTRRIHNGTRNVITAMPMSHTYLGEAGNPGFNDTIVGLYQYLKASLPVSVYQIREFLTPMFPDIREPSRLIDKQTLGSVEKVLPSRIYSQWMTNDGIEKLITNFSEESIRHQPIQINGHYLALIYKGPDQTYRILHDIDELPKTRNKDDVSPITYAELFYLSVYQHAYRYPALVTRYPIEGVGSIYPSKTYLRVTIKADPRRALDEYWLPIEHQESAFEFPSRDSGFVNAFSVHPSRIAKMGADYDGDVASFNLLYSDESIQENEKFLQTKAAYVGTDGKFINRTSVYTVNLVLKNMTS